MSISKVYCINPNSGFGLLETGILYEVDRIDTQVNVHYIRVLDSIIPFDSDSFIPAEKYNLVSGDRIHLLKSSTELQQFFRLNKEYKIISTNRDQILVKNDYDIMEWLSKFLFKPS